MITQIVGAIELLLALQTANASLTGVVRDVSTGLPITGASVVLTDLDQLSVTDAQGRYLLSSVPAGPQHVTVSAFGYAARALHALVPRTGQLQIDIALRTQALTLPALLVRSPLALRGLDGADSTRLPDRSASQAAVRNHPLLSEPDVFAALSGGAVVLKPESPQGVHVLGGAADQTAYALDGIPILSPYHVAGVFSAWNVDAITRVDLRTAAPISHVDALSAVVNATTRAPALRLRAQGALTSTQVSVSADGPLGAAGYLFSMRSGLPGVFAPRDDPSYLNGESGDLLGKLEVPLLQGRLRVLGYDAENEIDAAALVDGLDQAQPAALRNSFAWQSRSLGASWTTSNTDRQWHVQGWKATSESSARWLLAEQQRALLWSARRDHGLLATLSLISEEQRTTAGVRAWQSETSYQLATSDSNRLQAEARTPVAAAFVEHSRPLSPHWQFELGLIAALADGELHPAPQAQLQWRANEQLLVSARYARSHQFAQSLRNEESVVNSVFPADLYLGARAPGVPVARSDQRIIALEYRPDAGVRLSALAYTRSFLGLLLSAPSTGEPFAIDDFSIGSGTARGVSLDAAISSMRYGLTASYGWQRIRLRNGSASYTPEYGAVHQLEAGGILFLTTSASLRAGITGAWNRRTAALDNAWEWEACNLLDQGCEFGGSPRYQTHALGATELPAYWRIDVGARKHWHFQAAGRDALLGVFLTVTNVLGRGNVLTYAPDIVTGRSSAIEMRPRAPLVAGLDWRF